MASAERSTKIIRVAIPALLALNALTLAMRSPSPSSAAAGRTEPSAAAPGRPPERTPKPLLHLDSPARPEPPQPAAPKIGLLTKQQALETFTPNDLVRLMATQNYIDTTLIPELEIAGLMRVDPVNESVNAVCLPNEFVASEDGIYASQFAIDTDPDSGVQRLRVVAYGPRYLFEIGEEYYRALYSNALGHTESDQILGHELTPDVPATVAFVVKTNRDVNTRMAAEERNKKRPRTP